MRKPKTFICEKCDEEYYGDDLVFDLSSEGIGFVCENCFLHHAEKDEFCSEEDFEELLAGTTNNWETDYNGISGLNGRVFTSKVNGNTLFIPAASYRDGSDISYVGSYCYLWSSSLDLDSPDYAYSLDFNSDNIGMSSNDRYYGFSVRPVC